MNNKLVPAAVAAALSLASFAPAANAQSSSTSSELQALKAQLEALQAKVAELEKQQAEQAEAQERTVDAIAQARTASKESDWTSRISWKGDFRYRYENVDPEEATTEQDRQRIRARFGFSAKVNDDIKAVLQLATSGGSNDPRSTNQTLGSGWDRKGVAIDLAYVDYTPVSGLNVMLGKMPMPWQRVGSFMWDGDLTPEGIALKYASGPFFASAFGYQLSERSSSSDATLSGAQLGLVGTAGAAKLTGAIGYFNVGALQGKVTAVPAGCGSSLNNAFFGGAQGNTTVTVAGCPRLANDFNMVEALGQAEFKLGAMPLVFFVDYVQNQEANDLDTAYAGGVTFGKASAPQSWEFSYIYQQTEKDAQFGQFVDSDFGGGITDVKGSVIRFGYVPSKNWTLNGTYFMNQRFVDVGTERDYDRLQLDLNYKF